MRATTFFISGGPEEVERDAKSGIMVKAAVLMERHLKMHSSCCASCGPARGMALVVEILCEGGEVGGAQHFSHDFESATESNRTMGSAPSTVLDQQNQTTAPEMVDIL